MNALEKKTVILVTHQVEFLSEVDNILVRPLHIATNEESVISSSSFSFFSF